MPRSQTCTIPSFDLVEIFIYLNYQSVNMTYPVASFEGAAGFHAATKTCQIASMADTIGTVICIYFAFMTAQ